jgi:cytochrome c
MRQRPALPVALCTWLLASPLSAATAGQTPQDRGDPRSTDNRGPMLAQGMMGPGTMGPGPMGRGMMGPDMMGPAMMAPGMMPPGSWGAVPPPSDQGVPGTASSRLADFVRHHRLPCFGCHALSSHRVGPPFDDIAQRYAGQPQARAQLSQSITYGVSGRWGGPVPMPPGQASPAQAQVLADLILKLAR